MHNVMSSRPVDAKSPTSRASSPHVQYDVRYRLTGPPFVHVLQLLDLTNLQSMTQISFLEGSLDPNAAF
jgi:hypothetical protein